MQQSLGGTGILPVPACLKISGTGKMPIPQNYYNHPAFMQRQLFEMSLRMERSGMKQSLGGTGILPVPACPKISGTGKMPIPQNY
ncbi:hypothetical protein [Hydrocoleum sp. CS-953]|uniref:hypothetical protein n=1 Tax=Hydrocoleum sp. CS-953 TaxID=1671698 RepID=UPI00117A5DCB|nr:hypothetical protein [Hydrocoleum sp. CS-953]